MLMLNAFDSYERVARLYPSLIVSIPVIITCSAISTLFDASSVLKIGVNSPIVTATLVLLSNIVRHFGREIEPKLWNSWGGPPSTRFLRKSDTHFAEETKLRIYQKILKDTGIDLTKDDSDEKITQAFAVIRNKLRDKKNKGLWLKTNQEYGFARNLLGSRWVWVGVALIASILCFSIYRYSPNTPFLLCISSLINLLIGIAAIICSWCILPKLIKKIAERYAEDALTSYLNI
ncbi:hypothetical protein ACFL5X_01145 [Candidatus Omnitrophota bacterium]